MNAHANFKSDLRPLPMRISQLQFERLQAARARDGLAIQEHVRRALDFYLKSVEKEHLKAAPPLLPEAELPGVVSKPDGAQLAQALPTGIAAMPVKKGPPRIRNR